MGQSLHWWWRWAGYPGVSLLPVAGEVRCTYFPASGAIATPGWPWGSGSLSPEEEGLPLCQLLGLPWPQEFCSNTPRAFPVLAGLGEGQGQTLDRLSLCPLAVKAQIRQGSCPACHRSQAWSLISLSWVYICGRWGTSSVSSVLTATPFHRCVTEARGG